MCLKVINNIYFTFEFFLRVDQVLTCENTQCTYAIIRCCVGCLRQLLINKNKIVYECHLTIKKIKILILDLI